MKYAVVTGTSKGLGAAIAKLLMERSIHVIGLARNDNPALSHAELPGSYQHVTVDLADIGQTEQVFQQIKTQLETKPLEALYLIQNAAVVSPIEQVGKQETSALSQHLHVNLLSPMVVTNYWLGAWREANLPLVVIHVTSGAANRSVYGWSAYGSSKAALDRYTKTVALEQDILGTGHKVMLFDPSIMDTDMQGEIRSSDSAQFHDVEQFKNYKTDGKLRDTEVVAKVLTDYITNMEKIENGKYLSVKDIL
ncbi:SDR family NAD(P)-dependent oxidoreductase [Gracilibacillus alcaliphilus]|uniref:SDR family NAD(P)-dependent oxidoreductase n=1 Tax=Gracilibacillus alcaliphilus TaxID=1401441 RepID=UPI0019566D28|nr:SDR family NAD(P)-dependent oxidoreductase [Gracilibacillus alcaliphilus]MBM7675378.1 benzil reductase ((S)-benzoin forming) [Gracilibacillus alcaliphilus]